MFRWLSAALLLALPSFASNDSHQVKTYVNEVKSLLLSSYVDKDRLDEDALTASAVDGMSRALSTKEFDAIDGEAKTELAKLIHKHTASVEDAIEATSNYIDDNNLPIDLLRLADYGCMNMIHTAGDKYGHVFTPEEMRQFQRSISGSGANDLLGVSMAQTDGKWIVAFSFFGYPAHEWLEKGDEILEVGGKPLKGMRPSDMGALLHVPPGKTLDLKIRKARYDREYTVTLRQRKVRPPIVQARHLGEGVAYLRLTQFSPDAHTQVRNALKSLRQQGEIKSLIFDLRDNPGGALNAAIDICDQFISQGKTIATTIMNFPSVGQKKEFKAHIKTDYKEMPMVVLINGQSASASELTSGAIKDNHRAKVIGQTTFGKGVGQVPIPLNCGRFLYLTALKYFLPESGCPDHKGVSPDIEFAQPALTREEFEHVLRLRSARAFEDYVETHWAAHKESLAQLGENDGFDASRYPDLKAFASRCKAPEDLVRSEIRRAIRMRLEDERNALFEYDLEADPQLQKALVQLLD